MSGWGLFEASCGGKSEYNSRNGPERRWKGEGISEGVLYVTGRCKELYLTGRYRIIQVP